MTTNERRDIEERMRGLNDHDLLRLIAVEADDYRAEALEIARQEIRHRNLEVLNKEQYWGRFPKEKVGGDGFCETCRSQTTDESPGDTTTVNFLFGTRLIGHDDTCSSCGSVLQTKWFQLILPIVPLGRYRVIYFDKGIVTSKYVGRRLRR